MDANTNIFRILIIDDNPEIHHDFQKILTRKASDPELSELDRLVFNEIKIPKNSFPDFTIDTALQGEEGLEKIKQAKLSGSPYALAFVDIRMPPGWDGIVTIKHIWEVEPDIQIVICSAYSDYSWEDTITELGQNENLLILKKPFDTTAVQQLAFALTKKWGLLKENQAYAHLLERNVEKRTQELKQSLSISRGAFESSADGILVIDNNGKMVDYNSKLIEMWNLPIEFIQEKNLTKIMRHISEQVEESIEFLTAIDDLLARIYSSKIYKLEASAERVIELHAQPYKIENKISGNVFNFRDITARSKLENRLEFQASHDVLTLLPNRILLVDRIHTEIERATRNKEYFGVLFLDLDRFKLINDSISHAAGDELLKAVANRLQMTIRGADTLARFGGDEFVAVTSSCQTEEEVVIFSNKLLAALNEPFDVADHSILVTSSIGVAIFPKDGNTVDSLLSYADAAMYGAKKMGGKQSQFYTSDMHKESHDALIRDIDLRHAIDEKQFYLVYQPQYDFISKKIISVEALIRWQHPTRGVLSPIEFIPLAEETNFITQIGEWVLKTACAANKKWQAEGLPPVRVAVNISDMQFKLKNLPNIIKKILDETGLEPRYLELELTETVIINNLTAIEKINELKRLGVRITLDDFGTGYSSLAYLGKIDLDCIKIDQSFIRSIHHNRSDEIVLQAIITMARKLNLELLAEGVESKDELDYLNDRNCNLYQGFYFSEPLTEDSLAEYLKSNPSPPLT